jgi:hypothetical protein
MGSRRSNISLRLARLDEWSPDREELRTPASFVTRSSVRRSGSTVEVPSGGTGLEDDTFPDPPEDVLQPLYGSRRWSTADGGLSFA